MIEHSSPGTRTGHARAPGACPACGELTSLCRPRFFAGQLLTDNDLQALERYVLDQHRRHNRYLHGWGVACGMEVRCHPCRDRLTVTAGYALSPCGDDIALPSDATVPVCELIATCKDRQRQALECDPFAPVEPASAEPEEDWVLAVRYQERPARGITPLRGGGSCGCGTAADCGCGTATEHGCGCGRCGNGNGAYRAAPAARTAAGCEPTRTCESYAFEVLPAGSGPADPLVGPTSPAGGVQACVDELTAVLPPPPDVGTATRAQLAAWCRSAGTGLRQLLARHPGDRCDLPGQLAAIVCPDPAAYPSDDAYRQAFVAVQTQLVAVATQFMRACACSAVLPACPPPTHDPRVPLATVTVRAADCQVVRVCNWDVRKFLGLPAVGLQRLTEQPLVQLVERLRTLCCGPAGRVAGPRVGPATPDVTELLRGVLGDLAGDPLDLGGGVR